MTLENVGSKRTAESESGGAPPPKKKRGKKSKKSGGVSGIAALAQAQQKQKVEQAATTGGGAGRGGRKKARTFKEGFDKNNYVLVNRPKGPNSGQYTDCELHLWDKETYEKTPASKRLNPPKNYSSFALPPGRVVGSFCLGGVGIKDPKWSPLDIKGWSHSIMIDYSRDQEPIPDKYLGDAWAQRQQAEAAEAGDLLEAFQLFLVESAMKNTLEANDPELGRPAGRHVSHAC